MDVSRIRALRGPNLWSRHTAIEAVVRCPADACYLEQLPGFESQLRALLPRLGEIAGSKGRKPALADALEATALALQIAAGCNVTFSCTTQTVEAGTFIVVVEYSEEDVGRLAFDFAEKICTAALAQLPFDTEAVIAQLQELDEDIRLGPSTGSIVRAAVARGIPFRRLTQGSLVQFGWGRNQKRIQAAETSDTSAIAESIAQDKELTKKLLEASGVPVPNGRVVETADEAWKAACEIGGPVVLKPRDGNQGKGITVNIETEDQVRTAFVAAEEISSDVIVERYLPGHDFRALVIGGKLVAAARRDPPLVVGDGVHTIEQLVAEINKDPARGSGHATSLTKIRLDDIALALLAKKGLTAQSVPAKGVRVVLRNNANLSTGGTATDVTDDVHPDLAARAITAAKMVGLDICGVDIVCESVMRPLEEQRGGIVEVNAAPGLRMHLDPSYGKGRDVGKAIVDTLYAPGENGRIPVVAVAGTNGKTTTVRMTAHILAQRGHCVGMTNSDGVYIADSRIDTGDCSGPRSARSVLMHPDVSAAVFETARGGILREGLAFDSCDVAIVTNLGLGDHLGLNFIHTLDDLAVVKRVIVQNVAPHGTAVLNASDPMVAKMASKCPGSVTFFTQDPHHPVMSTHRAQGRRVVFVDDGAIVAAQGSDEHRIALRNIPLTRNGTIPFQVENAMASIAAAWALGIDWNVIAAACASFINDAKTAPGRFNVYDFRGATVIADYGHNPDAIQALVDAIGSMSSGRRSVVISGAGDRRDEDLRRQTEILGEHFDHVVLYEDACQRGRSDGEVLQLLREGLTGAKRASAIDEIRGEFVAIDLALDQLQAGDLCLILVDQIEEALAHIEGRIQAAGV